MARLALSIAGGILGAIFIPGVGAALGFSIGSAVGGIIGQLAFPGKGTHVYGPRLNDMSVSSSAPGTPIPLIFGSMRIGGQIIWSGGIQETSSTTKQSAKGAPSVSQTTYVYFVNFASAFCQGPATITRIWGDAKLIYDRTGTGTLAKNFTVIPTFHQGTSTQNPDPLIVSAEGVNNTPGFRGVCYAVWDKFPLIDFGNRLPNIRAEVTANAVAQQSGFDYGTPLSSGFSETPAWTAVSKDGATAWCGPTDQGGSLANPYKVARIDLVSNTVIDIGSVSLAGFSQYVPSTDSLPHGPSSGPYVVDDNGDLWGTTHFSGTKPGPYIVKIDPHTFQAKLLVGPLTDFVSFSVPLNITPFSVKGVAYIACTSPYSNWSSWFVTQWVVYVVRCSDGAFIGQWPFISESIAKNSSGDTASILPRNMYACADDNGNLYVTGQGNHTDGNLGDYHIFKVNMLGPVNNLITSPGHPTINIFTDAQHVAVPYNATYGVFQFALYDADDNTLVAFSDTGVIAKINPATGAILTATASNQFQNTPGTVGIGSIAYGYAGTDGNYLWLGMGGDDTIGMLWNSQRGRVKDGLFQTSSLHTSGEGNGKQLRRWNANDLTLYSLDNLPGWPILAPSTSITAGAYASQSISYLVAQSNGHIYRLYLDRLNTNGVGADAIVLKVCEQAGIDPSNVDVTQLASLAVKGYPIVNLQTGKDIIANLAQALYFEGRETDFKLQFVPRGQQPVLAVPEIDLGLESDKAKLDEMIGQEQDIPKVIEIQYIEQALDYQQSKQTRVRHHRTKKTVNFTSISLPIVMDSLTANQLADKLLWTAETERRQYKTNLWKAYYLLLDPCDVITFTFNGSVLTARVTNMTAGQNLATAVDLTSEDGTNYLSAKNGVTDTGFVGQTLDPVANTNLWLLDIPYLQDSDADASGNLGYYAVLSPASSGAWGAGVLYYSTDPAAIFQQIDAVGAGCAYGVCTSVLPAPANSAYSWDFRSTFTFRMINGAVPTNDTQYNVLNGTNAAVLYPSLEIIQFTTVTSNGDGTYTLSGLLRGRRGTEDQVSAHAPGETIFFPLENGGVLHEQLALANLNLLRYYKGVTVGQTVADAQVQVFTDSGADLKPYAPSHVTVVRSGSGGTTLTLNWIRRTRLGGSWNNGTENPGIYGGPQTGAPVPLSEDTESYDVDIIKAVSGVDTVVRTFVGLTSPTVVYSAAQQTTDFGAPVTSLHVKVYQNSAQVGRGFVADIPNVLAGHGTISGSVDASSINGVNVIGTPGVDGEVLTYVAANADLEWLLPSQPRAIFTKTTGSLASGAVEQSTIGMTKTFLLLKVTANKPCRLQLYSTAAAATADALRPVGVIPSGQHGVIADVSLETDTTEAWALSTFTIGSNLETSPSSNITYRITNDDSTTGTITINITIVPIER